MKPDVLRRPFPPDQVKQRQGNAGKTLHYVETHAVIARLNEGCDAWDFVIVQHQLLEEEVVVVGKLNADGVIKMAFGGSAITRDRDGRPVSIADDLKAAGSDALKKASSLLGVALELYGGTSEPTDERRHAGASPPVQESHRAPALSPGDRLTQRQLAAVYGAARRKNIPRGQLERFITDRTGKPKAELMSRREASDIISELTNTNGAGHG
jgi:hypothetical protein